MNDAILQLSAGGILAFLIIKEVLLFLKSREDGEDEVEQSDLCKVDHVTLFKKTDRILKYSEKLHEMHNVHDEDGVYSWMVPRSWARTQGEIVKCMHEIANTQKTIALTMERMELNQVKIKL